MRKFAVTVWATVNAVVLVLAVSACGDNGTEPEEMSPGDVALLYVDAFGGGEGLTEYNPDSSWDGSYFESLGASAQEVVGEPLDAEQTEQVAAAYREALGQIEAEVLEEQVDGDEATVTLALRGLAYGSAVETAAEDFVLDTADPAGSYTELLLEALDIVEPVKKPMNVEMTLTRSGDLWAPDGESGAEVIEALMR